MAEDRAECLLQRTHDNYIIDMTYIRTYSCWLTMISLRGTAVVLYELYICSTLLRDDYSLIDTYATYDMSSTNETAIRFCITNIRRLQDIHTLPLSKPRKITALEAGGLSSTNIARR